MLDKEVNEKIKKLFIELLNNLSINFPQKRKYLTHIIDDLYELEKAFMITNNSSTNAKKRYIDLNKSYIKIIGSSNNLPKEDLEDFSKKIKLDLLQLQKVKEIEEDNIKLLRNDKRINEITSNSFEFDIIEFNYIFSSSDIINNVMKKFNHDNRVSLIFINKIFNILNITFLFSLFSDLSIRIYQTEDKKISLEILYPNSEIIFFKTNISFDKNFLKSNSEKESGITNTKYMQDIIKSMNVKLSYEQAIYLCEKIRDEFIEIDYYVDNMLED